MIFSALYFSSVVTSINFEAKNEREARELLNKLRRGSMLMNEVVSGLNDCEYDDIEMCDLDIASPGYDTLTFTPEEIAKELERIEAKGA